VLRGVEAARYARESWTSFRNLVESLPFLYTSQQRTHTKQKVQSVIDREIMPRCCLMGRSLERVATHTSVSTASSGERGAQEPP
jgi:hypothetical protein